MTTKTLDLGCGDKPKNHFNAAMIYGVDIRDDLYNNIVKADLVTEAIPFQDEFFDYVTAYDFLEHVPRIIYNPNRRAPFVDLMSEIWRVLKVGGKFLSVTPAFPRPEAFTDPTHVNVITEQTFPMYFDDVYRWGQRYGFKGAFKIESQQWDGAHLRSILVKVTE